MSGFQEILVIVIIVLAILLIPRVAGRITARHADPPAIPPVVRRPLSGRLRLAILISVIWFLGALLYFRPWEGQWVTFGTIGALPLVIAWGGYWVFAGYQPQRRPARKRR